MSETPNVYVLSTVQNGINTTSSIHHHIPIKGMIGLSEREETDTISGYCYLKPYCDELGIEFFPVESYTLNNETDGKKISDLKIDCLLVLGWQRLVPEWLIQHANNCVIGVHGSASGITGGRGRSPQNWALILGKDEFHVSIFFIDPGIDSGDVIDSKSFPLTPFDTIKTSHNKVSLATAEMLITNWKNGNIPNRIAQPQSGEIRYLPKRTPKDGKIDWNRSSDEIHNFIRGQTKPYPGSFTCIGETKIIIWSGFPFNSHKNTSNIKPGIVIKTFFNGDFIVQTGNGALYVDDSQIKNENLQEILREDQILESADYKLQMSAIIERHQKQYPNLPLSEDILNAIK